jgi:hypothetical protein
MLFKEWENSLSEQFNLSFDEGREKINLKKVL